MQITVVRPSVEILTSSEALLAQLEIVERAGRTCYKSEGKMGDGTAEKFIKSIIARGHESVIEHGNMTIKFIGSRSMSHQLVRHRLCAYSQESQRYCDYGKKGLQVICPPTEANVRTGVYLLYEGSWFAQIELGECEVYDKFTQEFLNDCARAYRMYLRLRKRGVPAEDARYHLPNATKTEVVHSANWRQWRHMFQHRALNPRAQWEIRELMLDGLKFAAKTLPCVFGDLV